MVLGHKSATIIATVVGLFEEWNIYLCFFVFSFSRFGNAALRYAIQQANLDNSAESGELMEFVLIEMEL